MSTAASPEPAGPDWVPLAEVARRLSISRSAAFAWLKRTPRVKAMRRCFGARTIRYPIDRVLEYVAKHGAETPPAAGRPPAKPRAADPG